MKIKSALFLGIIFLTACKDDKLFQKRLNNEEISVDWYHYSYITSTSNDYVVVKKGNKEELILEYGYGLQDIELNNDTITIWHFKFHETPKVKRDSIFGYVINYRVTNADEIYLKHLNMDSSNNQE